jgi:biopolymer transport protein ExbD
VTPDAVELVRKASALPRQGGEVDVDALREELLPADENATCAHAIEIGARGKVTYQDLVAVMDVAVVVGRTDVGLFGGSTAMYPTKRRRRQPTDEELLAQLSKPRFDPEVTPVLVISTSSITLKLPSGPEKDIVIDDVSPLGDDEALLHLQERMREARSASPAASEPVFVLQADHATAAKLVIDATSAARAAGYDQILFAVKK